MNATQQIHRRRTQIVVCAAVLGLCTHPLLAADSPLQPLPEGWWHLSMEDIRAGDAREAERLSADRIDTTSTTHLDLSKQNQTRKTKSFDLGIRTEPNTGSGTGSDSDIGSSRREMRQSSPSQDSTDSTKDTTLRDYSSATTRALQKAGAGGTTNSFHAMSTTLPVKNLQVGLFNRTPEQETGGSAGVKQNKDATDPKPPPTTADAIAALPGSSYYAVPSSPLDVVKSSFASPQSQDPSNPYPKTTTPTDSSKATPSDTNSKTTSTNTPPIAGVNTNAPAGTSTATTTPQPASVGWVPATRPQQGFQPAGATQPFGVIRRPGGPNANGFYEPRSISDLQMGR